MSNNQGLLFNLSPAFGHFSIVKFPFLNSFVSESPLNLYKEGIFLWLATDWDAGVWLAAVEQVRSLINLCSLDPPSVSTPQLWSVQQFVTFLAGTLWEGRKEGCIIPPVTSLYRFWIKIWVVTARAWACSTIAVYVLIRTQGIRGAPGWLCAISDANLIQRMTATRNFSGLGREFYFGEKRGNRTRPSALT